MRIAVVALLLAACELQPAPKNKPPVIEAPAPPPPAPADAAQPDAVVVDAGPAPIDASQECLTVAAHLVDVVVATETNPAQKSVMEGERMQMTRGMAEACTKTPWSPAAIKCYAATKTTTQIKACQQRFPPTPPPAGGSAAPRQGSPEVPEAPTKGQTRP